MFRGAWTIGRVRGIPIRLHASLLLVLPFVALGFARHFAGMGIPLHLPPLAWGALLGVALFASVLLHELAHSLVALSTGGKVNGITLFFLGGVSEMGGDARKPGHEALIAAAGPLTSLLIGLVLVMAARAATGLPQDVRAAVFFAGLTNGVLGVFNLLPAFPMDGGRILRAGLTPKLGRVRATRVSAIIGRVFAVALGVLGAIGGDIMPILVAIFIFIGAGREAAGVALDEQIRDLTVRDVTRAPYIGVPGWITVADAAERMQRERCDRAFVVDPVGKPIGALSVNDLRRLRGPAGWQARVVDLPGTTAGTVVVGEPLKSAFVRLAEKGADAIAVVDETGEVVGVLARGDVERELTFREARRTSATPGSAATSHP